MIIACDFDGVIHDHKNPIVGRRMGGPIDGAKEALTNFLQRGDRIIVHSVWAGNPKVIEDWMKYYEIPYHEVTNIKPQADLYIDDKAVRFETWGQLDIDKFR